MGRGRTAKQSDAQSMTGETKEPQGQEARLLRRVGLTTSGVCPTPFCPALLGREGPDRLRVRVAHMEGTSMQEARRGRPSSLPPAVVVSGEAPGVEGPGGN